ncbi:MAG: hypothetical protein EAZ57_04320 [Cytophagales bacterium]|nr:MAG: hypothetical protein EAZ67_05340 [Cytophagales bacterium]TAF61221.1 MAG: hypothetical protein EAZ57_04320 [Cytophagales bacterium]
MKKSFLNPLAVAALGAVLFVSSCKDKDNGPELPANYVEATDAATGRSSYVVSGSTGTQTWKKDRVYVLDGFVFVSEGETLTIEPGTVIKGKPGVGEESSALIVARGGKIIANGTAAAPIIFTAEADKLDGNLGKNRGLWGGLIVLGKSRLNTVPTTKAIEGIPTSETRGSYGGSDDADNSGILRYVSIRHGGTEIGAGNEINGLTLGGVGSGTTVEYVEVFANEDDGIEYFGGTVNTKYIIASHCGDDALDYDQGYRGLNQFSFVYQETATGDRGSENDGGTDPEDGKPYATPMFVNATFVGNGLSDKRCITFRDNGAGEYHNSVFIDFGRGVDIELDVKAATCTFDRFNDKTLKLENNIFSKVAGDVAASVFTVSADSLAKASPRFAPAVADLKAYFTSAGNTVGGISVTRTNVVPASTPGALSKPSNSFFSPANYKGAFEPGKSPWYAGWTATEKFIK